mmetsp:Transcript_6859/g.3822  ORF Transcript_6859/g.3822 Transcript_6859/m.3822 type:complete len:257 (+) Transcript_6859:3435-4205(+)
MSELKNLKFESDEGITRITLARPKHNVFNIEMMKELNSVLESLIKDDELKCVVVFGEGPSWCAGVDVGDHKPDVVDDMIYEFNRIFKLFEQLDIPTIAAVHRACLGGGMEVAIACDIVLAADSAVFGQPEIKLGFFPPYAAVRLPQLVGVSKSIEICTTGKRYSAKDACLMGFVTKTIADNNFIEEVEKYIKEIKYSSPLIIRLNKQAVKKHIGLGFSDAIDGVSDLFLNTLMKTKDTQEGIDSFYEKRRPVWKNK